MDEDSISAPIVPGMQSSFNNKVHPATLSPGEHSRSNSLELVKTKRDGVRASADLTDFGS